jgi:hypothetical protein
MLYTYKHAKMEVLEKNTLTLLEVPVPESPLPEVEELPESPLPDLVLPEVVVVEVPLPKVSLPEVVVVEVPVKEVLLVSQSICLPFFSCFTKKV